MYRSHLQYHTTDQTERTRQARRWKVCSTTSVAATARDLCLTSDEHINATSLRIETKGT